MIITLSSSCRMLEKSGSMTSLGSFLIILYDWTTHKIYHVCKYLHIHINVHTVGLLTCISLYLSVLLECCDAANMLLGRPAYQSSDYSSSIATRGVNDELR